MILTLKDSIQQKIEEAAGSLGYMIYESAVLLKGENSKIFVKIDHIRGISHQDCENFSKRLSYLLDQAQLLPNYFLEISSPGLKRKLRSLGEIIRFTGSPVKFKWNDGSADQVVKGKILKVEGNDIILETEKGEMKISFQSIETANLDY